MPCLPVIAACRAERDGWVADVTPWLLGVQGVKKFGAGSWARILSSYEFSESRTAVDLKDKWRNMNKHEAEDA